MDGAEFDMVGASLGIRLRERSSKEVPMLPMLHSVLALLAVVPVDTAAVPATKRPDTLGFILQVQRPLHLPAGDRVGGVVVVGDSAVIDDHRFDVLPDGGRIRSKRRPASPPPQSVGHDGVDVGAASLRIGHQLEPGRIALPQGPLDADPGATDLVCSRCAEQFAVARHQDVEIHAAGARRLP
jgi:hypothetical protein